MSDRLPKTPVEIFCAILLSSLGGVALMGPIAGCLLPIGFIGFCFLDLLNIYPPTNLIFFLWIFTAFTLGGVITFLSILYDDSLQTLGEDKQ